MEDVFGSRGTELTLRRGPLGLVEAAAQCGLAPNENLLIFIDQFEEIFTLAQTDAINPEIIKYLNRLSDLLFMMARAANHRAGVTDVPWEP